MQIADMPNTKKYKYILKFKLSFSQSTVKVTMSFIIIIFYHIIVFTDHIKIYSLFNELSLTTDEKFNNLHEFQLGFRRMHCTICVCV